MDRRNFIKALAATGMASQFSNQAIAHEALAPGFPNHKPKIKRIIHLCMAGGMSQFETLVNKPVLNKMSGKAIPDSLTKGQQLAQLQGKKLICFGSQANFKKAGQSGLEMSEHFKHLPSLADDLCIIDSMHTDQINHDPAHTVFNTGTILPGRPSMGSWIMYALGAETNDLPGFVVMTSAGGSPGQPISSRQWHNGFLPGKCQGVQFNSRGDAVHYVKPPKGIVLDQQAQLIKSINALNKQLRENRNDPAIETRISQYELALKMHSSVPKLTDFSNESAETIKAYGCKPGDGTYASNCLMARRMAEKGVRFIQLYHRGWDHHSGVKNGVKNTTGLIDQSTTALFNDLKARGLWDDTLIILGSEFGRTPMSQGNGRDHHMIAYSAILAGGPIKGGMRYGQTDEFGYNIVDKPVHVRDLHATVLQLLGIDHHRLSYKFQGLDSRLTGVLPAKVIKDILV